MVMWGSNARERPPDLLPPRPQGRQQRGQAVRRRSPPLGDRPVRRPLARPPRRQRHRALEHHRPRDHPRRARPPGFHRPRHEQLRGVRGVGRGRGRSNAASRSPACPAETIRELAHAYATAKAAQLCWTLGITEHHNGVDNVLALSNLALLTGQVGRYGAGLSPLRGQNNVQGGGDMGALPNRLPGFQDIVDDAARKKFETLWGTTVPAEPGWHLTRDVRSDGAWRSPFTVRDRREPGAVRGRLGASRAPARTSRPHGRAGHLPHQNRPARRRRAARLGVVVRGRGHGHQLRAARAARAQGARSAGRGPR